MLVNFNSMSWQQVHAYTQRKQRLQQQLHNIPAKIQLGNQEKPISIPALWS